MDRTYVIEDKDFWLDLEFRLSGDLQSSDVGYMRRYWIDGFLPTELKNTRQGVVVCGGVWMAEHGSRRQGQWAFRAEIPQSMLHKPIRKYGYHIAVFDESKMLLALEVTKQAAQKADALELATRAGPASRCYLRWPGDR